jgi:predicted butyrate kinase (DUF1464 family)
MPLLCLCPRSLRLLERLGLAEELVVRGRGQRTKRDAGAPIIHNRRANTQLRRIVDTLRHNVFDGGPQPAHLGV